jgi:hypothetical protein
VCGSSAGGHLAAMIWWRPLAYPCVWELRRRASRGNDAGAWLGS